MAISKKNSKIIVHTLSLILILTLLLSTAMSALAWYDFTQSRTNDFRGTVAKTDIVLHKYERNTKGDVITKAVANAEFLLFVYGTDKRWIQIGGLYVTNSSGKISVEKLNSGNYKFVETSPGYGYDYDRDDEGKRIREYEFTISPDDAEGAAIVNVEAYNRRKTGRLEISKSVKGESANPEQVFEFNIFFGENGTHEYSINGKGSYTIKNGESLYLKHGETAEFENLPVGMYYSVTESFDPYYKTSSTGSCGNIKLNKTSKAKFINTYGEPEDKKTTVTVKKTVEGELPAAEKDRAFGFTLVVNEAEPFNFTLKNGETKTFELNSGDSYYITEDDPFAFGYLQSSVVNGAGTACEPEITVTFTNSYIGRIYKLVEGEKTWELKGSSLPDSVTIELLANGELAQTTQITSDEDGKWLYSFTAPQYDDDGKVIKYTIREAPIEGFESIVEGFNIKNIYKKTETSTEATRPTDTTAPTTETTTTVPSTTKPAETTLPSSDNTEHSTEASTIDEESSAAISTSNTQKEPGSATTVPSLISSSNAATNTAAGTRPTDKPVEKPSTGDTLRVAMWTTLMVLSLLGIVAMTILNKHSYRGKYQRGR